MLILGMNEFLVGAFVTTEAKITGIHRGFHIISITNSTKIR